MTGSGSPSGLHGGGLTVSGSRNATVGASTFQDNWAYNCGGAIACLDNAYVTIWTSTLTLNTARICAGALYNAESTTIVLSTLSDNHVISGPGDSIVNVGPLSITNSTLYQSETAPIYNEAGFGVDLWNSAIIGGCEDLGIITTHGGNLESPGDTCSLGTSDIKNYVDPLIQPLAMNGGPTLTHRFAPTSFAVDNGLADPGCTEGDQRGVPRPQDGNGDQNAYCDIGALESIFGEIVIHTFESGYTTGWSNTVR